MTECQECRKPFVRRRFDQLFCSGTCRKAEANREMVRGKVVYRALYHWANNRKEGKLLSSLSTEGRFWAEEDKRLGLSPPPHPTCEGGYLARDRLTERLANADRRVKLAKELHGKEGN